jgi:hypothetical protein
VAVCSAPRVLLSLPMQLTSYLQAPPHSEARILRSSARTTDVQGPCWCLCGLKLAMGPLLARRPSAWPGGVFPLINHAVPRSRGRLAFAGSVGLFLVAALGSARNYAPSPAATCQDAKACPWPFTHYLVGSRFRHLLLLLQGYPPPIDPCGGGRRKA